MHARYECYSGIGKITHFFMISKDEPVSNIKEYTIRPLNFSTLILSEKKLVKFEESAFH